MAKQKKKKSVVKIVINVLFSLLMVFIRLFTASLSSSGISPEPNKILAFRISSLILISPPGAFSRSASQNSRIMSRNSIIVFRCAGVCKFYLNKTPPKESFFEQIKTALGGPKTQFHKIY